MSMKSHNGIERRDGPVDWGVSRTKQSQEAETNINNIIKRYTRTGQMTHISEHLGQYRDVSGLPDLHEAMNIVADAQSMFNELPAAIRKRVGHDVGNFLPFIDDPDNFDECVELGLLPPAAEKKPVRDADSLKPIEESKTVPTEHESPVQGGE